MTNDELLVVLGLLEDEVPVYAIARETCDSQLGRRRYPGTDQGGSPRTSSDSSTLDLGHVAFGPA